MPEEQIIFFLWRIVPSVVPIRVNYIESIKNTAQLRRLIFAAEKISNESYDASEDIDTILDQAERGIMDVTRMRRGSEFESSQTVIHRVMEQLIELAQ